VCLWIYNGNREEDCKQKETINDFVYKKCQRGGHGPIERMETDESNKVMTIFLYNVINTD